MILPEEEMRVDSQLPQAENETTLETGGSFSENATQAEGEKTGGRESGRTHGCDRSAGERIFEKVNQRSQ